MSRRLPKVAKLVFALILGRAILRAWRKPADSRRFVEPLPLGDSIVAPRPLPPQHIGWKRWLLCAAAVMVVLGIGGFLTALSGVVPIKASSGHWAITRWILEFSKARSVATHTLGMTVPELDHPSLILKGAGHFESGCAPCHGSPSQEKSRVAEYMLPSPPRLQQTNLEWDPAELFYIVKHGIKFTGMPSWPTQKRDDEVWAMVAFLRQLPQLDGAGYQRLVYGEEPATQSSPNDVGTLAGSRCARCHGPDGNGRGAGAFPKLAGQHEAYLLAAMKAYAAGERASGLMEPIAAELTSEEMQQLAQYYSRLPVHSAQPSTMSPHEEGGKAIAFRGIPDRRIPSCAACHLPKGAERNPHYPRLAGQYSDYLALQLELFKSRKRAGTEYSHIMHQVAAQLTPEQMKEVAAYFASLSFDGSERQEP